MIAAAIVCLVVGISDGDTLVTGCSTRNAKAAK